MQAKQTIDSKPACTTPLHDLCLNSCFLVSALHEWVPALIYCDDELWHGTVCKISPFFPMQLLVMVFHPSNCTPKITLLSFFCFVFSKSWSYASWSSAPWSQRVISLWVAAQLSKCYLKSFRFSEWHSGLIWEERIRRGQRRNPSE